jgi:hypothetical protein
MPEIRVEFPGERWRKMCMLHSEVQERLHEIAVEKMGRGDAVHVFIDRGNGQLVVRPIGAASAPLGLPARRYTVDRHANIRITSGTQARAGLHGPWRQIEPQGDALIVTAG